LRYTEITGHKMSGTPRHAIDATIAGLEHSDLWHDFWQDPESGAALTKLIEAFAPLAQRVMERMAIRLPPHIAVEDLLQSALVGLYHAITRFDPAQGVRFETFATPRIRGAILDELRASDHASRSTRALSRKIESTIQQWNNDHKSLPTESELAKELNLTSETIASTLAQSQPLLSLDSVVMEHEGHPVTLMEIVADDHAKTPRFVTEQKDRHLMLHKAFLKLTAREQKILYLYYFEELRLSEIACLYDVTEARICQIHAMVVTKLRALLGAEHAEG
jgi:RNA polymerase sigma factor for flagellar operon FliA